MIANETTSARFGRGNERSLRHSRNNVGATEGWLSLIIGGGLLLYGVTQRSRNGFLPLVAAGALIYRGATGHCAIYELAGIDTSESKRPGVSVPHREGIKVQRSILVNKSPEELYGFWRNPENLPRFMSHLTSVRASDDRRSQWRMKSLAGTEFEWVAEIVNDKPDELIAWRTLEGADMDHAGSVHFERAPGNRGTDVRVVMEYRPPAGKLGVAMARLFGEEPEQIVGEDLRRFKQLMETGEIISVNRDA
jgi:uncharacterized membrane protein